MVRRHNRGTLACSYTGKPGFHAGELLSGRATGGRRRRPPRTARVTSALSAPHRGGDGTICRVGDGHLRSDHRDPSAERGASIDELLDRAVLAINRGDRAAATALAGRVLAVDRGNIEAEDLLAASPDDRGEIRRLTILFADIVDSTALSTRLEPEAYRLLVGRYREQVQRAVDRYGGHIASTKGDGLLAVFGHPVAHENDARRAVQAGLEITQAVGALSEQAQRRFGVGIDVRVGVHRGPVYLDIDQDDVFGMAANVAARVCSLAPAGSVVASDAVELLTADLFEMEHRAPATVKGVEAPITYYRVIGERAESPPTARAPLIGRERELARLQKSWRRAQAGILTTPALVMRGEPGIGKSRLALAACELVKQDGGAVLELYGSPLHAGVGLHPVRTLLERRCGITRLTDAGERLRLLRAELVARGLDAETAVPLLAPVLGIGPKEGYLPVAAEGRKLQQLISEAICGYLLACGGSGAGLVVAEDVQWFDPSTIEVLGSLIASGGGRLLMVLTARDSGWLPPGWPVTVFDLAPLTAEQSDELIAALHPALTEQQRVQIRDRCDGVPFYLEQVVADLAAAPPSESGGSVVPETLYEPLRARLRGSRALVRVAEAAAVIGRQGDRSLLAAVVDLDTDQLNQVIKELQDARVFELDGRDGWSFRHELLREVAAELTPPSLRRGLHAKAADALVNGAAGEPDWPVVAAHYQQAARHGDAASAYRGASAAARRRGALAEARTYLDRAVTQLECCPPGPDRDRREVGARLQRGYLAAAAEPEGNLSPVSVADFERCLQLVGTDLRDHQVVATFIAAIAHYVWAADLRRTAQLVDVLRRGADQEQPWLSRAIHAGLGVVAFLRGEFSSARAYFEQGTIDVAPQDQVDALWSIPTDPVAWSYVFLAVDRVLQGDPAAAEARLSRAVQRAEQLGFPLGPYNHVWALRNEIWIRCEAGQLDRARTVTAELIEQSERHGFDYWQRFGATEQCGLDARALLASTDRDPGAVSIHIATMTMIQETLRRIGVEAYRPINDAVVGRLLMAAGRHNQAREWLDAALRITAGNGQQFYDAELLRLRAHTLADTDARAAGFGAALDLAIRQGAPLFELRAALDDFDLRGQSAREGLSDAASRVPSDSGLPELARARKMLE
ncbi:MAG: AAA family ATPase [Mycobacteriaceae bacterium]|nr:AAA family ATPase [Mycobacteriaceae bacterium]MBV9639652.1 AAA family ATPase [Mycobacteriaceae bacterium]